ncbi:type II toxin-antitoxin system Phd/YefM family antitoxin [bacterium]|nr:type II toxin-antitoxin system Phd/YefM family antitoxin [bacterium]
MPRIVPIRDLKNTTAISTLCHEDEEPIFVTKNGYGDMVLMSIETYEKSLFLANVYGKLEEAKDDMRNGRYSSVEDAISRIREKHGL